MMRPLRDSPNINGSPAITPLRIAKRDGTMSPTPLSPKQSIISPRLHMSQLSRRTSNTYGRLHKNTLVSKSPFRASVPAPSTSKPKPPIQTGRRVSGEKRPRPPSFQAAPENENGLAVPTKRERRQSKVFASLHDIEPVSKSPFIRTASDGSSSSGATSGSDDAPPPPPKTPTRSRSVSRVPVPSVDSLGVKRDTRLEDAHTRLVAETAALRVPQQQHHDRATTPTPSPRSCLATPSPGRSSLKTKRLLGPRDSGARRERRKTVTWDERCDVVEFDRESSMEDPFLSDEGESEDDYFGSDVRPEELGPHEQEDDSMEVDQAEAEILTAAPLQHPQSLPADDSIVGLVESMIQDATGLHTPTNERSQEHSSLEDEDGVPYGRTHHADRARVAHEQVMHPVSAIGTPPFALAPGTSTPPFARPSETSTPPRSIQRSYSDFGRTSPGSHVPLGRTAHAERARDAHRRERSEDFEEDADQLPGTPSPVKRSYVQQDRTDDLVPKLEFSTGGNPVHVSHTQLRSVSQDPFSLPDLPHIKPEQNSVELSFISQSSDSDEPAQDEEHESMGTHSSEGQQQEQQPTIKLEETDQSSLSSAEFHDATAETPLPSPAEGPQALSTDDQHEEGDDEDEDSEQEDMLDMLDGPGHLSIGSIGQSEISLSGFAASLRCMSTPPPPEPAFMRESSPGETTRAGSPVIYARLGQPPGRGASPSIPAPRARTASQDSLSGSLRRGSPRISREDVHKRLLKKRSMDSPMRELGEKEAMRSSTDSSSSSASRAGSRSSPVLEQITAQSTGTATDPSVHDAVIQQAEKRVIGGGQPMRREETYDGIMTIDPEPGPSDPPRPAVLTRAATDTGALEIPGAFDRLSVDRLSVEIGKAEESVLGDMRSALDRLMDDVASGADGEPVPKGGGSGMRRSQAMWRMEVIETEGVKPGRFEVPRGVEVDESMLTEMTEGEDAEMEEVEESEMRELLASRFRSPPMSRSTSESTIPPAVPPKNENQIRAREELILEKRREARQREEDEAMGRATPPRAIPKEGRPGKRRSMSTGDAEELSVRGRGMKMGKGKEGMLSVPMDVEDADPLADCIAKELVKLDGEGKHKYYVRERETTIYASADEEHVSHHGRAGDINAGRAWKAVRRPSDMNEYSKQIKEYRAQKPGKAHGKVFVKVLGAKGLQVPLPQQPTALTCTLNNGIHYVTTPECRMARDCRVEQEFELIEHSKLEFTLTLKVRRDPHIIAQFKTNTPPPPPPPVQQAPPPASKGGGVRSFLFGSPKKQKVAARAPTPQPAPVHRLEENLARYLKPDGTLARAFVSFKDIAQRCDTRVFEMSCPLVGQKTEAGNKVTPMQVGELVVQVFRFPPLPGVPPEQLPQSLDECIRGMKHIAWHKVTYFEGTLTQNGGDCASWRRRQLRLVGANLIAFNDVTKRAMATIDLRKALAVEDDQQARANLLKSPESSASRARWVEEFDGPCGVERSFRLVFPDNQEIAFFADTDEEKMKWLEILRALVGRIPPNPLWAELLWQRQAELARQAAGASTSA